MNNRKTPRIRFKGFTDDWEQRKLGNEVIEILAGGDINKIKIVEDGKYPIYANALTNCGIVGYYDDYYRVKAPAVTVTGRGEVGLAQARMTDFTPVVRLLAIRSNHDCYFLENAINNHKVVVESTGVPQLTVPQLSSYSIFFPKNIEEETRIGEYFRSLDQLITLHQRKLEKLKIVKKAMLENCFPKNGEKVPKFRFSGFTGDWEQRKLGELFNFHYGDGNNNPSNGGKYPVFGAGGIQGGYTKYNAENSVIIGHMGDAGCVSWGEGKHFVTYNGTITKPKDEVFSAKFGYYLLLNMNLRKYRGGSGLPFLTYDMLTEMETRCTNSKIETQKIADYFTHLDHLITLHHRKLEKLKLIKKSFLEKMFV